LVETHKLWHVIIILLVHLYGFY